MILCAIASHGYCIASGDQVPESVVAHHAGARQADLLDYWNELEEQVQLLHKSFPRNFHPVSELLDCERRPVKWFVRPRYAIAIQAYHFAMIQLLHNRPYLSIGLYDPGDSNHIGSLPGNSALAYRHASYKMILHRSRQHAEEIMAISNGLSKESATLDTVQFLWASGLVLGGLAADEVDQETYVWRQRIIAELRSVEANTGWETYYRTASLP
jgi:hypothetical protein